MNGVNRSAVALAISICASLGMPAAASAHGLVARDDLPLPPWLFAWAATAVLVASFLGLAVLWTTPRLQRVAPGHAIRIPLAAEVVAGAIGVAVFAVTMYAGLAGTQVETANLAPTMVFVVFWVAIPFTSLVLGDVFRLFSPWRAVGRAVGWLTRRLAGDAVPEPMAYPVRLGRWPAVIGVIGFAWVELVSPNRADPSFLASLALVYFAIQLIGMSLFGEREWTEQGDAFGGLFSLFARLAPVQIDDAGIALRRPLSGAPSMPVVAGSTALLFATIGSTTYDGFSQSDLWLDVLPRLQDALVGLGFSKSVALQIGGTLGLLTVVAGVALLYRVGIDGVRSVAQDRPAGVLAADFAHTLIPIGAAYLVAHYLSLLAFQGQALAYLVSDPLGNGADLFGTADRAIDYSWLSSSTIWYLQTAAMVAGHVAGLILAHDRAIARFSDVRVATRSQYWMLAVMVCFTSLGLWLLSAGGG